jgi:hypothetical protein
MRDVLGSYRYVFYPASSIDKSWGRFRWAGSLLNQAHPALWPHRHRTGAVALAIAAVMIRIVSEVARLRTEG